MAKAVTDLTDAEYLDIVLQALRAVAVGGQMPTQNEWNEWRPPGIPTMRHLLKRLGLTSMAELAELAGLDYERKNRVDDTVTATVAREQEPRSWHEGASSLHCTLRRDVVIEIERVREPTDDEPGEMRVRVRQYLEVR